MKLYFVFAFAVLMAGCASPEERRQTELMSTIEKKIRFPVDAGAMNRFARVYKFASRDRVVALYYVQQRSDPWFCKAARKGGRANGQTILACPPPDGMNAGERRWIDSDVHLPDVCDDRCDYVDVEYDIPTQKVISSECHGSA